MIKKNNFYKAKLRNFKITTTLLLVLAYSLPYLYLIIGSIIAYILFVQSHIVFGLFIGAAITAYKYLTIWLYKNTFILAELRAVAKVTDGEYDNNVKPKYLKAIGKGMWAMYYTANGVKMVHFNKDANAAPLLRFFALLHYAAARNSNPKYMSKILKKYKPTIKPYVFYQVTSSE
jgi:hypothetical protein